MGPLASLENILPLNYIPSAILQLCFYIESRFFPIQYFVTTALPPHFFLDSLHLPSHPKVYFIFIHMYSAYMQRVLSLNRVLSGYWAQKLGIETLETQNSVQYVPCGCPYPSLPTRPQCGHSAQGLGAKHA